MAHAPVPQRERAAKLGVVVRHDREQPTAAEDTIAPSALGTTGASSDDQSTLKKRRPKERKEGGGIGVLL